MPEERPGSVDQLVEHFFRHEAGRLVASLTRIFGWQRFALVEDVVQDSLMVALETWSRHGVPDNPAGWMRHVAKHRILDALRHERIGQRVLGEWAGIQAQFGGIDELLDEDGVEDSQLRMLFACCHPQLACQDQLALTLKALGGFGSREIARALMITDAAAKKRLQRAIHTLGHWGVSLQTPGADELAGRLEVVHQVLYLLFNEGYSTSSGEVAIRVDLCEEAARLCGLLCRWPVATPTTCAVMALMLFHAARFGARLGAAGHLLLMDEQDRRQWDDGLIREAQEFLCRSGQGSRLSRYHLEAAIAWEHCRAASVPATDWRAILQLYDALLLVDASPISVLNRAVALAQIDGPQAGIRALTEVGSDERLLRYHLYDAVLGEFHRRSGTFDLARRHLQAARRKTASPSDHDIIDRRLAMCR